ncbi:hypothetical protein GCM10010253_23470 [Streptomyces badius]|uniref:Uncharacterized protein n=1 Tax=Streptomyces badius TaxID=1941 RepID=A0ABQ2T1T4_STRBA|nr:hypothetical protein GCM10010253_23470 [Streptomyces badius]
MWNSKEDVTSTIVGPKGPECPDEAVFPPALTCAAFSRDGRRAPCQGLPLTHHEETVCPLTHPA